MNIVRFFIPMILLGAGILFLYFFGIPALEGTIQYQFYADSATYHKIASGEFGEYDSWRAMLSLSSNLLGPLLILKLAQQNYYVVLCLNIVLFCLSVELIQRAIKSNASSLHIYILLLANPITVSSLLAVNKEIFSLFSIALLLYGLARKQFLILALALVFSLLVRWQLVLFDLVAIFCCTQFNILKHRRLAFILLLLIAASILIWMLDSVVYSVRNFNFSEQSYDGSGLYDLLIWAQKHGLYWLAFIPKSLHLLFGLGVRMDRLFDPTNLYNDVWQLLHSTALLVVFVTLLVRRKFKLQSDLIYLSVIYLTIFALSPIYVPRYFYPVYVLWAIPLIAPSTSILHEINVHMTKFIKNKRQLPVSEGAL